MSNGISIRLLFHFKSLQELLTFWLESNGFTVLREEDEGEADYTVCDSVYWNSLPDIPPVGSKPLNKPIVLGLTTDNSYSPQDDRFHWLVTDKENPVFFLTHYFSDYA